MDANVPIKTFHFTNFKKFYQNPSETRKEPHKLFLILQSALTDEKIPTKVSYFTDIKKKLPKSNLEEIKRSRNYLHNLQKKFLQELSNSRILTKRSIKTPLKKKTIK